MSEQPEKPTGEHQPIPTVTSATATEGRKWNQWFGWICSPKLCLVLIATGLLLGPLLLTLAAKMFGATHELGVEVAKLTYSWPVAVGVCVVVFILTFREPLHRLISGMRRLKAGGFEMEAEQQAFPQTDRDPRKGEITWEAWFLELGSKLSSVDREVISKLGQIQQQAFTLWIRRWWFERAWGRIYGTQVGLVELLAAQPSDGPIGPENAVPFFERHMEERIAANPSAGELFKANEHKAAQFAQWIGFLESARLIEVRDHRIAKTPLTTDFVEYMREQGYTRQMRIW